MTNPDTGSESDVPALMPDAPRDSLDEARALAKVWSGLFGGGREAPRVDQYYLLEELGAGAMGVVYSAYDPNLQRHVALKLLHRDRAVAEGATARLLREARALAKVSHPNVIGVHAVGTGPDGGYIAMEYVEGGTLADWLAEGPHPWRDVLQRFVEAGRGLTAAHDAGIVHRDFKPANVLVGADGVVRVADFGLAWESDETVSMHPHGNEPVSDSQDRLTATGTRVGTPAYMAPEQRRGEEASAAADQFAFCVSVYEGVWGQRPQLDPRSGVLLHDVGTPPASAAARASRPPAVVLRALQRGMAEDPADRFPSLRMLVQELESGLRPPTLRRALPWSIAAVSVLGGMAALLVEDPPQPVVPADPCGGAAAQLEGTWGEDRGRALAEHLRTVGTLPVGYETRVVDSIDTYSAEWVEARTRACSEYHAGTESAELFDTRSECLGRSSRALAEAIGMLEREKLAPAQIEALLGALAPVSDCGVPATLMHALVQPTDPVDLAAAAALLEVVDREFLRAEANLPPTPGAIAEVKLAAEQTTDRSAQGNAYRFLAGHTDDPEEQRRLRVGVVRNAILSRDAHLLVLGYFELAWIHEVAGDHASAGDFLDLATAANRHLAGLDPSYAEAVAWFEGGIQSTRAGVARSLGDWEGALHASTAAAAAWAPFVESHPLWVANALNNVGEGLRLIGRPREAVVQYDRALALATPSSGVQDLRLATLHNNRGAALIDAGEFSAAEEAFARGIRHMEGLAAPPQMGLIDINLATISFEREQFEVAQTKFQSAEAAFTGYEDPAAKTKRIMARQGRASVTRELGQAEAALLELEDIARLMIEVVGPRHPRIVELLIERALALQHLGRLEEAYEDASAAVRMQGELGGVGGAERAKFLITLADIEVEAGRAEARQHVELAVELIEALESPQHPYLARAQLLLGELTLATDRAGALACARKAIEIVERHGLGPRLRARIEKLREAATSAG